MADNTGKNFIEEFIREIAEESGVVLDESETSRKLLESLERRVLARAFLEMVGMLTPEQAKTVKNDMDQEGADMDQLVARLSQEIPDFQLKMAQVLARIKMEMVEDIAKMTKSKRQMPKFETKPRPIWSLKFF